MHHTNRQTEWQLKFHLPWILETSWLFEKSESLSPSINRLRCPDIGYSHLLSFLPWVNGQVPQLTWIWMSGASGLGNLTKIKLLTLPTWTQSDTSSQRSRRSVPPKQQTTVCRTNFSSNATARLCRIKLIVLHRTWRTPLLTWLNIIWKNLHCNAEHRSFMWLTQFQQTKENSFQLWERL